ncbi:MAG TPA: hypothetical protein V6D29_15555 [Leptolyngbyaceae cyanobacterium]
MESYKLTRKLRKLVERELENTEVIQWIEQPIPRFFTHQTIGVCLGLLFLLSFFSFVCLMQYKQATDMGRSVLEIFDASGTAVFLMGALVPPVLLVCILLIPLLRWLEARQTVYVITDKRVLILKQGSPTTVTSFMPSKLSIASHREHQDGSSDVVVYIHQWKDYDGDIHTQEMGFKQIRYFREFERALLRLASN